VLVEAEVLDRDDRLDHGPRDLAERDVDPVLVVERRDGLAVDVLDLGPLGQLLGLELLREVVHGLGHVAGGEADHTGERDRQTGDDHAEHRGDEEHDAEVGGDLSGRQAVEPGAGHAPQGTGRPLIAPSRRDRSATAPLVRCDYTGWAQ